MKSKVILFCVLLFCSKIVDSIPHSENHVRQRVEPLSNWQVNKKGPNAQYLETDFTQARNENKLTNSAIQQENNEDYYSNHRGYNYDAYGYNKGPASSPSSKELLVNYNSPADGRSLDFYPPRVEPYPSHTSQVGFDHQQHRNQKWQSQNPFTNSVPSSVFIPDDERPLVTSVQEPYRGLDQYVQSKYVPSLHRRSRQPARSYLTREQLQYPSIDHSGVDKYVVNSATRFVSGGLVPYDSYSDSQAPETKTRPSGVRRHVQDFESPSEVNEAPAVESSDTLVDQSENIRYPVPYENYREDQVSGTKTRPTGIRKHVQNSEINHETSAVEPPVTLVDQSQNIRYPVPYENYREDQVSGTKRRPTGIRKHVQNSEINYETLAVEPPVTLIDQSENIRYPVPYEDYRESQVSETKSRPNSVRRHIKNIKNPSEINYETPAVESSDTLINQSENIRYHVPYENYGEGRVSETKARQTGIRKHVQNSEINYKTLAVEPPVTLVDQSENIRYPVSYENYREGEVSETKTRLTGVQRHVQDFESQSKVNYESPAAESPDALVDQSENIRYPVPYKNYRESQASDSKTKLPGVRRHVQGFETPSEINYETPAVESPDTDQFESIRYLENSRTGLHLSNSAPVTSHDDVTPVISDTDIYSLDSRPSNLVPIVNANKEATVEISKILTDKLLARKYAHTSDYRPSNSNDDVPTDITETIEVKESKYGANYAEEKAVPIETYPEDSLTQTNTVLENSKSHTNEENNVRQYGSSSPNSSKQNAIHHLTSEIKELSLKSLVANPEIQHILSSTDKRYVVVHSNGTVEFMDKLPLNSKQDSKLRLVHTKRKNIDGSEGDGVLTPQWPQNLPSNIAKNPAPVDEYPWATNNQPADEYETNPFKNLPAGHSHLKPLPLHEKQPADNENSKLLPPPVTQYSKLLIPNEDQPVDDSNSNQPKDDENSKSLGQPAYEVNPKPILENQSGDDNNSNSFALDVNHPRGDAILKHWTSPEEQPRYDDKSKLLLTDANQRNDKINLTPYIRQVHDKRHKHAYVPHPANATTFNLLLPNEAQPRDDRNSEPAHHTKPKHSNGNQPGNDDYSNTLSPNKNQSTDDIHSEPLNENLSGDDIVYKRLHPYYRQHKKSKPSHVNISNPSSTPESLDYPVNQPGDDNPAKPLSSNENQLSRIKNSKRSDTHENQTDDDDSEPMPSHNRHPAHRHKSKHFNGSFLHEDDDSSVLENQQGDDIAAKSLPSDEDDKPPEDDKNNKPQILNEDQSEGKIDSEPLSPHKKPQVHHNIIDKLKHLHENLESENDNSNPSWQHEKQPEDDNFTETLTSNEDQSEVETDSTPTLLHKKPRPHYKKPKHSDMNHLAFDDNSKLLPSPVNQPREVNNPKSPTPSHDNEPATDNNSKQSPSDENDSEDDKKSKLSKPLPGKEPVNDNNIKSPSSYINQPAGDKSLKQLADETESTPSPHKKPQVHHNKVKHKHLHGNLESENDNSNPSWQHEKQPEDDNVTETLTSNEDQSEVETDSTPTLLHKKPRPHYKKPKHSDMNQLAYDDNSKLLSSPVNQPREVNNPKSPKPSHGNEPATDDNSKQPPSDENHSDDDKKSKLFKPLPGKETVNDNNIKSSSSYINQPAGDKTLKQLADETQSTPSPHKKPQVHHNTVKHKHFHGNLESENDNSNPSWQHEKQPEDDNVTETLTSNEDQSEVETDSTPTLLHKKPRPHYKKPKHSDLNQLAYDDNSKLLPSPVNQPREVNNPKSPKPSHGNEPATDNNSKQPPSDENHSEDDKKSKLLKPLPGKETVNDNNITSPASYINQPAGDKTLKQLADETESTPSPHKKQRAYRNKSKSKHSPANQPADNNASPVTYTEDKISKPLSRQTKQHSRENLPAVDSTIKPLPLIENYIFSDKQPENEDSSKLSLSPENPSAHDNDFKPLHLHKRRPAHRIKSKHPKVNKPANGNNSNPASPEKNQLEEDNGSKPLPSIDANQLREETYSTPPLSYKQQRGHHKKKKHFRVNKSVDDNNSKKSPDETQTEDDKKSKSLPTSENRSINDNNSKPSSPEETQPEDDIKSKPTPSISSKNGDKSKFTTLSPTVPSYTTTPKPRAIKKYKRKYSHRKTTTNSPVVSTTPSPIDSSEDQIITLSPIEQVTDNVSDIPTLTTTTAKPVNTSDKEDTYKDLDDKQDEAQENTTSSSEDLASISDNIVQTSTTTATPSTSTSRSDNASDDKTKGKSEENENVAVVSKENYEKDDSQTDANTDVPEETDEYSPDIPSPSLQNDVDTGEASGDISSELEHSETDVTITVSSSTIYDSEDEIVTIIIEVSESTDDANSPSNDKTLVVNIDTNPDNDDGSKALQTDVSETTKTENCNDDHNHDDSRGENVEIDLSHLKGEPTMWIKTTNQDFIDKLISKNDTQFDVIYFFSIENQPIIEREKETTIFCNGTVFVETTEITYAHKDDLTPTVIKTTEIMQIEDYELHK